MAIYSKNSNGEEVGLNEWANTSAFNREDAEDETVCHCNIKENAELIAAILDWDVKGAIFNPDVIEMIVVDASVNHAAPSECANNAHC